MLEAALLTLMCVSAGCVLYCYAGYPLLVALLARLRRRDAAADAAARPAVSVLIAAFNEERVIAEKIENALALDWPADRLEIVVASDGSTDRTNEIVRGFAARGVRLVAIEQNRGKMNAMNATAPQCRGDIVVFSDANSLYEPDAVRHLVAPLADSSVGAVCGELRYRNAGGSAAGESEGLYWRYERAIKRAESRFHSLIGANGSIYAIRRGDYVAPESDLMDDLTIPLLIATRRGRRTIYEPRAVATEEPGGNFSREFRRKVRIVSSALYSLMRTRRDWIAHPALAFEIVSHKFLRWLVPFFLLLFLGANAGHAIASGGAGWSLALLAAQGAFYLAAALGRAVSPRGVAGRLLGIATYFCVVNYAALLGVYNYFAGRRYVTWTTIRADGAP